MLSTEPRVRYFEEQLGFEAHLLARGAMLTQAICKLITKILHLMLARLHYIEH